MDLKEQLHILKVLAIPQKRAKLRIIYMMFMQHHEELKTMGVDAFINNVTFRRDVQP